MPIEIRELVVKTTIETQGNNTSSSYENKQIGYQLEKIKESIIQECISKIEEKLERNTER